MSYIDGEKSYKVPEHILRRLIMSEAVLQALEAGGVDNWCWYSESRQDYLNDYFSDREPQWFEENEPDFGMIADEQIERYEEV